MEPTLSNKALSDLKVNIKIQLAAMWTSVMFCYIYGDYFELYVPGKVAGLVDGNNLLNSPMNLFLAMVLLLVPALMITLSVLLPASLNRVLNMVFAVMYTLLMLLIAATSISAWRAFYVFLALVESAITAAIFFKALRWPREPRFT